MVQRLPLLHPERPEAAEGVGRGPVTWVGGFARDGAPWVGLRALGRGGVGTEPRRDTGAAPAEELRGRFIHSPVGPPTPWNQGCWGWGRGEEPTAPRVGAPGKGCCLLPGSLRHQGPDSESERRSAGLLGGKTGHHLNTHMPDSALRASSGVRPRYPSSLTSNALQ